MYWHNNCLDVCEGDSMNDEIDGEIDEPRYDFLDTVTREVQPLTERMVYEISQHLFDEKKLLMISDLSVENINQIFRLIIIDEIFYRPHAREEDKNKLMNLTNSLLKLTISKNRKSREEIIDMFKRVEVKTDMLERKKRFGIA